MGCFVSEQGVSLYENLQQMNPCSWGYTVLSDTVMAEVQHPEMDCLVENACMHLLYSVIRQMKLLGTQATVQPLIGASKKQFKSSALRSRGQDTERGLGPTHTDLKRHWKARGDGTKLIVLQSKIDKFPQGSKGQRGHIPIMETVVFKLQSQQFGQTLSVKCFTGQHHNVNNKLFCKAGRQTGEITENSRFMCSSVYIAMTENGNFVKII